MMRSRFFWVTFYFAAVICLVGVVLLVDRLEADGSAAEPKGASVLLSIGPRLISNQTDYPVMIYGQGFEPGLRLRFAGLELETQFIDPRHLGAVIPAGIEIPAAQAILEVEATVPGAGGAAKVTVVNDAHFVVPLDLEVTPERIFVASRTTDELLVLGRDGELQRIPTCDGPRSLALHSDEAGVQWLVVACEFGAELRLVRAADPAQPQRSIPLVPGLQSVIVSGGIAWVSEHRDESILAVALDSGEVVRRLSSPVDPRPLALLGNRLLVGNGSSEDLSWFDLDRPSEVAARSGPAPAAAKVEPAAATSGTAPTPALARAPAAASARSGLPPAEAGGRRRIAPTPTTPTLGGHTESFAPYVMGGKRPRAIVASQRLGVFFVSSLGPNVGPNPERMEVTMNGGIGVVDSEGNFLRHVALRQGMPEGLALDEERGILYVADVSTGRVELLDAALLAAGDEAARGAFLASIEIPPSADTPRLRQAEDFGVEGRATESLHSGPSALRLSGDGHTLWVLARFAGAVQAVDLGERGKPRLGARFELGGFAVQPARRLGEIAYTTDLGRSRMSCEGCHPDGHTGGILFTKGRPMRIYRSPTMRSVRDSAPYFTPSMLPTLKHMARDVLGRNRFYNPRPERKEIAALAHFTETITPLPNPYVGPKGELPRDLSLPDGGSGDAVAGLGIFERSGCQGCHPSPQFTTDQDPASRGRLYQGMPLALPLRPQMQDMELDPGWPPVSLVGVWDVFPLLASGSGGLEVQGDAILPSGRLALREVLEAPLASGSVHGAAASLSDAQRDDLIAYLLTL